MTVTKTPQSGRWILRRLLHPIALVAVPVVLVAAGTAAHRSGAARAAVGHQSSPAGTALRQLGAMTAAAPESPGDQAVQFQALLGHHSILAADMMRARLRGDPDFAQAADAALTKNTAALSGLVEEFAGEKAEYDFGYLWKTHIQSLFNYARGLADQDNAVRDQARKSLLDYEGRLATFFVGAAHGRLAPSTARAAVTLHVDHLLRQADAYAKRDYTTSGEQYRESYQHTYGLGGSIASALLSPAEAKTLNTPTWRLRSELTRLLGEHVALAVAAMRSAHAHWPDFDAAAANLNANTIELTKAVDGLFGASAARAFQSLWADHIDQLVRYTAALASDNGPQRTAAVTALNQFQDKFAAFLAGATGDRLGQPALTSAMAAHDRMLVQQIDAFAAAKYQQAHDIAYTIYTDVGALAGKFATAFGATAMAHAPQGGIQTGYGGMATLVESR